MTDTNLYATGVNPYLVTEALNSAPVERAVPRLGGWLLLVGCGLVLSPFRIGGFIVQAFVPILTDGTWQMLTTPGSAEYHVLWAPLLIFELGGNLVFLLASLVLLVRFFRKSLLFPRTYVKVALASMAFVLADHWLAKQFLSDAQIIDGELIQVIAGVVIWVPYMLMSRRVRNTFVN